MPTKVSKTDNDAKYYIWFLMSACSSRYSLAGVRVTTRRVMACPDNVTPWSVCSWLPATAWCFGKCWLVQWTIAPVMLLCSQMRPGHVGERWNNVDSIVFRSVGRAQPRGGHEWHWDFAGRRSNYHECNYASLRLTIFNPSRMKVGTGFSPNTCSNR